MPPERTQSIGAQLSAAMEATGVSIIELARRINAVRGEEPTEANRESRRRWVQKILRNPNHVPNERSRREIEEALGLDPGYFTVPVRGAAAQAHREQVEDQVVEMEDAIRVLVDLVLHLCEQVIALGGNVPREQMQSDALASFRTPPPDHVGGSSA